jgi:hypothetical protein
MLGLHPKDAGIERFDDAQRDPLDFFF